MGTGHIGPRRVGIHVDVGELSSEELKPIDTVLVDCSDDRSRRGIDSDWVQAVSVIRRCLPTDGPRYPELQRI